MDYMNFIQESRLDDFKTKYKQKFSPENLEKIGQMIPQKYFEWVGKVFDNINFDENFAKLSEALKQFEKISTNLPKTDINQYQNAGELIAALDKYNNRVRRDVTKVQGGNVVYDDGKFFVVNPLTHDASCYYGKGTKWCTAAESDYQFKKYNEDGKLFYILDRTKATNDPLYKVALLKKFDGDTIYYDSKDDVVKNGWILNTNKLNDILSSVDSYLTDEYGEQIKIYSDKASARKERERLDRLREQQRVQRLRNDAQDRRDDNEWGLDENCPEEGLKAHALLKFLVENGDVNVLDNDDRADIQRINDEIESDKSEYENEEDEQLKSDLLINIERLQDELTAYDEYIDVYHIVPSGNYYDTTEFEVIDSPISGYKYAVGDDDEMQTSCYHYVDQLIDDIGYEGFSPGFAQDYLDEDAIVDIAQNIYDDDVRNNPESYFSDEDRDLSNEQEEEIELLNRKIERLESHIEELEEQMDGENDDDIQEKVEELNEVIQDINDKIEEIQLDPEGDVPEDMIEAKVDELVSDAKSDTTEFMTQMGLDWADYLDKDAFIKGVIDADGYGHTLNSYDGSAEEIYVNDKLYYVMRID